MVPRISIFILLILQTACNDNHSITQDVFFYPVECDGSPVEYGYLKIYKDTTFSSGELEFSGFVERIDIDINYAIHDEYNGFYNCYLSKIESGAYFVVCYSSRTKKKGYEFLNIKGGSFYVSACN